MPRLFPRYLLILIALLGVSCGDDARIARGFRLPDGDIDRGREAFLELGCHRCHTVAETKIPEGTRKSQVHLDLGGKIIRVKTYGELVTSIIKPDHIVTARYLKTLEEEEREKATANSPMPSFNDRMTVTQLVDIVTFLHSRYEKLKPDYSDDIYHLP